MATEGLIYGSLVQVWSFVNGLQLLALIPTFDIVTPVAAAIVCKNMLRVAHFDMPFLTLQHIFSVELGDAKIAYADSQFNLNLESLGFDSAYVTPTVGAMFIYQLILLMGLLLVGIGSVIKSTGMKH